MGLLKLLGLSTAHEGQHAGNGQGSHQAGKHTKKAKGNKSKKPNPNK